MVEKLIYSLYKNKEWLCVHVQVKSDDTFSFNWNMYIALHA